MQAEAIATNATTDAANVAACLRGNRNAFAPLVERYQSGVYNFCYRYTQNREDAFDLSQEVFLRAFRFLNRYKNTYSFRNWLYTIAANTCHDWSRHKNSRPATASLPGVTEADVDELATAQDNNPAEIAIATENAEALEKAIASLPEEYRICLILFYIEELSQAEICEILHLPVTVVKNRLYRARLRLRQMLEEVACHAETR